MTGAPTARMTPAEESLLRRIAARPGILAYDLERAERRDAQRLEAAGYLAPDSGEPGRPYFVSEVGAAWLRQTAARPVPAAPLSPEPGLF